MANYILYYRVSTTKQGSEGLGIASQKQSVGNYATQVGATVIGEFTEVESGKTIERISVNSNVSINTLINNRPQLQAAIKLAKEQNATIIVKESSRLSRSSLFISFLIDAGVKFVCADSPQDSEMIIKLKTILAEDEIKKISERTSAALQQRKKQLSENGSFISKSGKLCLKLGTNNFNKKPRPKRESSFSELKGYIDSLRKNNLSYGEIEKQLKAEGKEISKATVYRLCAA